MSMPRNMGGNKSFEVIQVLGEIHRAFFSVEMLILQASPPQLTRKMWQFELFQRPVCICLDKGPSQNHSDHRVKS